MKITFLGTGTSQGVPIIGCQCCVCTSLDFRDKRLRTALHIEIDDTSIIVDCGPDFRQQVLREKITKLDAILFTHEHKDHTAGLDDIRGFNFLQNKDMPLYATRKVIYQLQKEFEYIFTETKYPGVPRVETHEITNAPFVVNDIPILPIEVMHYKLPVFGFRIHNFAYVTDANFITENELQKLLDLDVLVLNALQQTPHISHFTLAEALEIIAIVKPKKAYLTHISHNMGLHNTVSKQLPSNVFIAYDGLKLNL